MLNARVKYILVHLGKLRLLIEYISERFALGIPHTEGEENDDLGTMPRINQWNFHVISHFFLLAQNYCQVPYQTEAMPQPMY